MKPVLIALIAIFFASPLAFAESQVLDQVVAVVNDEVITQSEMDVYMRPVYEDFKKQYSGEELAQKMYETRQKLVNQLVEDRLAYQEAKTQKIEVDEATIDKDMEDLRKRFKNDTEMEDMLTREGLTLSGMRERLKRQTMIRHLQDREIRARVVVSPIEVETYYNEHPEDFSGPERLRVRSFTIKKDPVARDKGLKDEASMNKIADIRKKILSGESFGELAKQFSQDTTAANEGMGDWMERGSMIPIIDEVIFNLKKGEVSKVIESPMGYHLFRVEEKEAKYHKTLAESREAIYGMLYQKKSQERFQEWMKDLKRNAYISLH